MTKPMVRIHNLATNEIIDCEMTDDEYAVHVEEQKNFKAIQADKAEKVALRNSAFAKLATLGLTEDEINGLIS